MFFAFRCIYLEGHRELRARKVTPWCPACIFQTYPLFVLAGFGYIREQLPTEFPFLLILFALPPFPISLFCTSTLHMTLNLFNSTLDPAYLFVTLFLFAFPCAFPFAFAFAVPTPAILVLF